MNAILRDGQVASLHVFCFLRRSREESSELTNVGALKIAETLQQSDARTPHRFALLDKDLLVPGRAQ